MRDAIRGTYRSPSHPDGSTTTTKKFTIPLPQGTLRYRVTVPAHPLSVRFVRDSAQAIGDVCGKSVADNLTLVMSELVTNAIRHAGLETVAPIDVTLEVGSDAVKGAVTDPGTGFEVGPGGPSPKDEGGFGLCIVDRLANEWGVDSTQGGTTVWFALAV